MNTARAEEKKIIMDQKLKMNKAILNAMKFTDIRLTREEKNREKLFITADEIDSSPIDVLNSTIFTSKTIIRN